MGYSQQGCRDCFAHAQELHRSCFVVDAHYDLLPLVLAKREEGATRVIEREILPPMKQGGIDLVISGVFVHNDYLPEMALKRALKQISVLHEEMDESPGMFRLCRSVSEAKDAADNGELAIMLSLEGVEPIGNDLSLLRVFYELGIRGVGLTWSRRNYAADGCFFEPVREGTKGGLTDFGMKLIDEAMRLGMYIDISHLNDEGAEDLFAAYDIPIMASHSNCRRLAPTMRNVSDEIIQKLAAVDGVIGVNVQSFLVGNPEEKTIDQTDLADHIDHIRSLVGIEHVGFGFDFCDELDRRDFSGPGPHYEYDCIKGYAMCIELTAELLARGYSDTEIEQVLGGNMLRFLERTVG